MKLAYFSPLPPQPSGIADFSAELLPFLRKHADIDLFVTDTFGGSVNLDGFCIRNIEDYASAGCYGRYDFAVFHMGNNLLYHKDIMECFLEYGGVLELHDVSLHNLVAEATLNNGDIKGYKELIRYCHGQKSLDAAEAFFCGQAPCPWDTFPLEFTMSKHLIDRATGVIVHSDFARQMVKAVNPYVPVALIRHHTSDIVENFGAFKSECRKQLLIEGGKLIIGSFGEASSSKRIVPICQALAQYKKKNTDFHYYIVGKNAIEDLTRILSDLELTRHVTVLGYTDLQSFKAYMGACDIPINLRYPTRGESSGSMHRLLGLGKAVIVTDIGTFREFPDEIAIKVRHDDNETDDILAALELLSSENEQDTRGRKAQEYAKAFFDLETNAKKYSDFFVQLRDGWVEPDIADRMLDRAIAVGLGTNEYITHLVDRLYPGALG